MWDMRPSGIRRAYLSTPHQRQPPVSHGPHNYPSVSFYLLASIVLLFLLPMSQKILTLDQVQVQMRARREKIRPQYRVFRLFCVQKALRKFRPLGHFTFTYLLLMALQILDLFVVISASHIQFCKPLIVDSDHFFSSVCMLWPGFCSGF